MKLTDAEKLKEYLDKLEHPLLAEIHATRAIILGANAKILERIKWNAPSYYCPEDFVTFNPRNQKAVHLVFHHPSVVLIQSDLLEGDYKDRRMMYLNSMDDIHAKAPELTRIINELVTLITTK